MKEVRNKIGMTRRQLAERVGTTVDMIAKIENGQRNPSLSLAKELSAVLQTDINSLFFANSQD